MLDDTPSVTAFKVALIIVMLGGDAYGRSKCPPNSSEAQLELLKACCLPFYGFPYWFIQNPIFAKLARWSASLTHANLMEGVGIRKCYMEEQVRTCLNNKGATQVLIVGAGYDTLAWRLASEFPQVQFYEVDHPATSRVKQVGLQKLGSTDNLHTIMADLTLTSLEQVVTQQDNYNTKAKSVVVVEGLLYYLSENQVKQLFADVANVVGPSSCVCFDFFGYKNGRLDLGWMTPLLTWSIKFTGEPWKWGIDPNNLATFFQDTRWRVCGVPQSVGIERLASVQLKDK